MEKKYAFQSFLKFQMSTIIMLCHILTKIYNQARRKKIVSKKKKWEYTELYFYMA